jgi:hypothetical protein
LTSRYQPHEPARRPGNRPVQKPEYRVLVHRKFSRHWSQIVDRIGIQGAQQFWDHISETPGGPSPIASITLLKGAAGKGKPGGWSRTHHYEISGAGRINYQYHNEFKVEPEGDAHKVVAILTIDYGSH